MSENELEQILNDIKTRKLPYMEPDSLLMRYLTIMISQN